MSNKIYEFEQKPQKNTKHKNVVYKESRKKKFIRIGALLGALIMFLSFLVSIVMYIF